MFYFTRDGSFRAREKLFLWQKWFLAPVGVALFADGEISASVGVVVASAIG